MLLLLACTEISVLETSYWYGNLEFQLEKVTSSIGMHPAKLTHPARRRFRDVQYVRYIRCAQYVLTSHSQGTWLFMSNGMLAPDGRTRKQTLQDDMESLLYVVLYCSFLFLPHNLSEAELARTITHLFEANSWSWYLGDFEGGAGKVANALRRQYTDAVAFNPELKEWLNTVMDYNNPPRHLRNAYYDAGKWSDPDQLDNFWEDFLRTHNLERNDRNVHNHPHATDRYGSRRLTDDRLSSEAISLGGRRSSQPYGDEDPPAVKRPRIVIAQAAVEAPRRSERKRKEPSDAPPASPPARKFGRKEVARSPPRTRTQVTRVARRKK